MFGLPLLSGSWCRRKKPLRLRAQFDLCPRRKPTVLRRRRLLRQARVCLRQYIYRCLHLGGIIGYTPGNRFCRTRIQFAKLLVTVLRARQTTPYCSRSLSEGIVAHPLLHNQNAGNDYGSTQPEVRRATLIRHTAKNTVATTGTATCNRLCSLYRLRTFLLPQAADTCPFRILTSL